MFDANSQIPNNEQQDPTFINKIALKKPKSPVDIIGYDKPESYLNQLGDRRDQQNQYLKETKIEQDMLVREAKEDKNK